jgi:hypothetical protein
MSRLAEIARLAGIDPRRARSVSGVTDDLLDTMVQHALAGLDAAQIVAAVGAPVVQDGFRRRALAASDAQAVLSFLSAVRRRLVDLNRSLDAGVVGHDALLNALRREARA